MGLSKYKLGEYIERSTANNHSLKYKEDLIVGVTSDGVRPTLVSKAISATMPQLTNSSASQIWRISTPCSSTTVCHRASDSLNSIR